jgi:GMP synthase-like glutamine amidotransferase
MGGSKYSAYNYEYEWVVKTHEFLARVYHTFPQLKYLGICFGAQMLAEALGGKVDKVEPKKKDPTFYISGGEVIQLEPEFFALECI